MNLKNDYYFAVLNELDNDIPVIVVADKSTWDSENLLDDIGHIDYVDDIKVPGYYFESSEMIGCNCIDTIEREDDEEVDMRQLKNDLIAAGYTINDDVAKAVENGSDGYLVAFI